MHYDVQWSRTPCTMMCSGVAPHALRFAVESHPMHYDVQWSRTPCTTMCSGVAPHALRCAVESHPMHYDVQWSRTPPPDRGFHFHIISRVPLIPLTEEDSRNRRAGIQNKQLNVALSLPYYIVLKQLPGPYKRILVATKPSRSL